MPKIDFLYFADCPSHERALALLRQALTDEGFNPTTVNIIEVETETEAEQYQFYGSPTIRVNGLDIAPLPSDVTEPGLSCRVYQKANGRFSPLPPLELIVQALRNAKPRKEKEIGD
jgi:hypothetical protein